MISPASTRHMAALLQKDAGLHWDSKKLAYGSKLVAVRPVGVDATVVELKGKEHWWWDTQRTNDGGPLHDDDLHDSPPNI